MTAVTLARAGYGVEASKFAADLNRDFPWIHSSKTAGSPQSRRQFNCKTRIRKRRSKS